MPAMQYVHVQVKWAQVGVELDCATTEAASAAGYRDCTASAYLAPQSCGQKFLGFLWIS